MYTCVVLQTPMYGANVVIFEGIMAFANEKLRDIMDLKVFVDTDADVRLARRWVEACVHIHNRGSCKLRKTDKCV